MNKGFLVSIIIPSFVPTTLKTFNAMSGSRYSIIKYIFVIGIICHLTLVITAPAVAEMTGGGYTINIPTISGGGEDEMTGGSYRMQDIKGQGVIGEMSAGSYRLGLGGIYGTLGAGEIVEGVPEGTVLLNISRVDNNLLVTWSGAADLYWLSSDADFPTGIYYDNLRESAPSWNRVIADEDEVVLAPGELRYSNAIIWGPTQIYFKGVQPGRSDRLAAALAVGMHKVRVTTGWNQIATPFEPMAINQAIGTNFTNGDQLWAWRDGAFISPITFNGATRSWGSGFELVSGEGYGLNLVDPAPGTWRAIIGRVNYRNVSRSIAGGWNLIGNPYAHSLAQEYFPNTAAGARNGDQLWEWRNGVFRSPWTFDGTNWPAGADITLHCGKGYGYNHLGAGVDWSLTPIYR